MFTRFYHILPSSFTSGSSRLLHSNHQGHKEVKKEKLSKRQMVFNAELVEKLEETLINPIKNHHNYKIKPSRGVLLHGQSGLGKERARQFQS